MKLDAFMKLLDDYIDARIDRFRRVERGEFSDFPTMSDARIEVAKDNLEEGIKWFAAGGQLECDLTFQGKPIETLTEAEKRKALALQFTKEK